MTRVQFAWTQVSTESLGGKQLVKAKIQNQAECLALCGICDVAAVLHSQAVAVSRGDTKRIGKLRQRHIISHPYLAKNLPAMKIWTDATQHLTMDMPFCAVVWRDAWRCMGSVSVAGAASQQYIKCLESGG